MAHFQSVHIYHGIDNNDSSLFLASIQFRGHHQPTSKMPFEWHFACEMMVARCYMLTGSEIICIVLIKYLLF